MKRTTYLLCVLLTATVAQATTSIISMTADDGFGASSFNSGLHWSDGLAPSAGNAYTNADYLLRTPADANSYVFGGDSLTITSNQALGADLNDALMFKGTAPATITVNNLTINGGALRNGFNESAPLTVTGSGLTVGDGGMAIHAQGAIQIDSPVSGSGLILIKDSGSSDGRRKLIFNNAANTYNGSIELQKAWASRFQLASGANLDFVIGAAGVNNSIYGYGNAALDGIFQIDLTNASTTIGDSWTLVNKSTLAAGNFGSTFSVAGFSASSDDTWLLETGGTYYKFFEATGVLQVVPEPASLILLGLGSLMVLRRRR